MVRYLGVGGRCTVGAMSKPEKSDPDRDDTASTEPDEGASSPPGDDFWGQWSSTSTEDLTRDTYGTQRQRDLQKRFR